MTSPIKREVTIGNCRLLLGDCLPIMRQLPNVDAVLTDPPFGIGRDGQKRTTGGNGGRKAYEFKGWDAERPDRVVFDEILKIAPAQIIWGGNYFADMLPATGQ
jgi:DNA modification methylase